MPMYIVGTPGKTVAFSLWIAFITPSIGRGLGTMMSSAPM